MTISKLIGFKQSAESLNQYYEANIVEANKYHSETIDIILYVNEILIEKIDELEAFEAQKKDVLKIIDSYLDDMEILNRIREVLR